MGNTEQMDFKQLDFSNLKPPTGFKANCICKKTT